MTSSSLTTPASEDAVICLAMVLAWFGKQRTLAQCRAACMPDRDGITTESLIEASRMLGLWAEDWVMQGADAFDNRLSLPAIVSWHERHFVVVERITRRHVILIDPAIGRRRISRGLFDRFCSGVAVTFARADRETRWMTGLLIASTILLQICSLSLPVGTLLAMDHILSAGLEPSLWLLVTLILLVVVAHAILQFVRSEAIVHLRMVSRPIVVCLHAWFVVFSLCLVVVWSPRLAALALSFVVMQVCVAVWAAAFSASRQRIGSVVEGLISGMGLCSLLGLLVLGAHEVLAGRLTMAGMVAVNVLAASALIPVGEMTRGLQQFLMARARFERLRQERDRECEGWR
jgi:ABC-type bacteriocin/lantibiotic exporter with double-glycine peptidase domain